MNYMKLDELLDYPKDMIIYMKITSYDLDERVDEPFDENLHNKHLCKNSYEPLD